MHRVFSNLLWHKYKTYGINLCPVVTKRPFYPFNALHEIEKTRSRNSRRKNNTIYSLTWFLRQDFITSPEEVLSRRNFKKKTAAEKKIMAEKRGQIRLILYIFF